MPFAPLKATRSFVVDPLDGPPTTGTDGLALLLHIFQACRVETAYKISVATTQDGAVPSSIFYPIFSILEFLRALREPPCTPW